VLISQRWFIENESGRARLAAARSECRSLLAGDP
jgi:hypothetical protein